MRAPRRSVSSSAARRARNWPIGLTGRPAPDGIAGSPPTSIDSRSNGTSGRPVTATWRAARSIAVASARISRAPGAGGQRREVDMRLLERIVAADQAGQHAGVRRLRLAADQGQANAWLSAHGEAAQHLDMGVAGTEQDEIGRDRCARLHSGEPSRLAASRRSGEDRAHDMVHSGARSGDRRAGRGGGDAVLRGGCAGDPCRRRRRRRWPPRR